MNRPPREPQEPILTIPLIMRTGLVTLLLLASGLGMFLWETANGTPLAEARTIVINAIIFIEAGYLLNCRCLTRRLWDVGLFSNKWIWWGIGATTAVQLLFTYTPLMNRLFHTAPISAAAWARILAAVAITYVAVAVEKGIRRRYGRRHLNRVGNGGCKPQQPSTALQSA